MRINGAPTNVTNLLLNHVRNIEQIKHKKTHKNYIQSNLLSTSGSHSHGRLECVVDPPLEASESTDH